MRTSKTCGWSQKVPYVRRYFVRLIDYGLEKFMTINEEVYNEAIRLLLCQYVRPDVPELLNLSQSNILENQTEFTLSNLCQTLDLGNVSDYYYFTAFDDLPAYSRT